MKGKNCIPYGPGDKAAVSLFGHVHSSSFIMILNALADELSKRLCLNRREFLKSQMGLAATFLAFNSVYGHFFDVARAEAEESDAAAERIDMYAGQFIFDVQVHYVHDEYPNPGGLLSLRRASERWNPGKQEGEHTIEDIRFDNFFREVFQESQTKAAILSNAPDDNKNAWFLTNEEAMAARERVNSKTGRRSLLAHALLTPGQPGWMDELEKALELKPDAMKAYTLGEPGGRSKYPWKLDDEKVAYPAYEKIKKAGIKIICVHKGLLPTGYRQWMPPELIEYAKVDDVGPAARDWPDLTFVIYHSAIEKVIPTAEDAEEFKKTGRIDWVTDLAEIPAKYGVSNVHVDLGAVFAATCAAHPELCAGVLGTLIRNLGADHVSWGTDSVWFGSPQWQIEALRRFEIPESLQKKYGFNPLGPADGQVKRKIFGENSAQLYGLDPADYQGAEQFKIRDFSHAEKRT
ncbi:MAG: amidohydrolase [Syntrophales bacterium]|nr:amidohydrolase [Syntrophales bacterium]